MTDNTLNTVPKQAFNFEQAINYLKSIKDNIVTRVKKIVKDNSAISVAPRPDRQKFLAYGISLLHSVETEEASMFFKVTGKSSRLYSNSELADMFRKLLMIRAGGYTIKQVAYILHEAPEILEKVEIIAVEAVKKAIAKSQAVDVPILGGLN
jgi:hypothetical protein